ncbi:MAG: MtrB/PioB family decaheme-associated outer membrane protein [Halioglobus sp.]|nr:MtrB/PioB family decaheme-associated outer membrane protein [Halioglobus sp.]
MSGARDHAMSLTGAAAALLLATAALARDPAPEPDPYAPLMAESRPLPTRWQTDYRGALQLGLAYTGEDNTMFGQYNGLSSGEPSLIGQLQWQDFSAESYWRVSVSDLGLDTREGEVTWGRPDRLRLRLGFDAQQQVRNDSARTPYGGGDTLRLPDAWVSGSTTGKWTALQQALHPFERELTRERISLALETRLSSLWRLYGNFAYEDKHGTADTGAAIYTDASGGDALLLPSPVDFRTAEFDLGLNYDGERLHLDGRLSYSDFDNRDEGLRWQNPYDDFGPAVSYPAGEGQLALAPDNEQTSARLRGQYVFSATTRLQFDGSYAVTSQDQDYLDYTVNSALRVNSPPPRDSYDGEVATGTLHARLLLRPATDLDAELFYRLRDRDYDAPRAGYRYVRGDGGDQPGADFTVYNSSRDLRTQIAGAELAYRLPLRGRLHVEYARELITRRNAAVDETGEDRYTLGYRVQPWPGVSARFELQYGDRAADTYHWDQSYYALLDPGLINATPDNQRYTNHPALSQYHLSNRERRQASADFSYQPDARWSLGLNLSWRDDDFDQSELGLTDSRWQRVHLSASYAASRRITASVYGGYDRYRSDQAGRAFRGGQEKNAFAVYPPLPQASDPGRNWQLQTTDDSFTAGASVQWQVAPTLALSADYSYVDTQSEQDFTTPEGSTLAADDLPRVNTRLHQIELSGSWQLRDDLALQLDYQYYRYRSDDWARQQVGAATVDKLLSFGEGNPNEQIHYVGASVIYRWQ